jgi:hypothetical protein
VWCALTESYLFGSIFLYESDTSKDYTVKILLNTYVKCSILELHACFHKQEHKYSDLKIELILISIHKC